MEKYSYISGKVLRVGRTVVSSDDLTKLNAKSLELAIKNKIIKKNVGSKKINSDREDSTRQDSEES